MGTCVKEEVLQGLPERMTRERVFVVVSTVIIDFSFRKTYHFLKRNGFLSSRKRDSTKETNPVPDLGGLESYLGQCGLSGKYIDSHLRNPVYHSQLDLRF